MSSKQQDQQSLSDIQHLCDNVKFKKQHLESNEEILLVTTLYKFNDYKKRQLRGMVITTYCILNLKRNNVQRKIPITKIKGITISTMGFEFVLHIPEEYDYRFLSLDQDHRNSIIKNLLKCSYNILQKKQKMDIYFKEELTLLNFTTTKKDKHQHISRMPKGQPQQMDDDGYQQIIDGVEDTNMIQERKQNMLFSRDNLKCVQFGDFLILRILGSNLLGKVMLVEHKDSTEWFVLKCIKKDEIKLDLPEDIDKVDAQVRDHANTPFVEQLAFCLSSKYKFFFYTQFMRGGVLSSHMKNKSLDEQHVNFYAACLTLGLGAIHSQGYSYKNLNPQAIMMDDHGYLILTDFHWDRFNMLNEHRLRSQYHQYIAPENLINEHTEYGQAHDWWGLGVIIYEMIYGFTPYQGFDANDVLSMINQKQLQFPSINVSPACKTFISDLLEKDPKKRIGFKQDFQDIIQHPWFQDMNWELLYKKQLQAPTKPNLDREIWTDHFEADN